MSINLNDEKYDVKDIVVFNDGKSGVVEVEKMVVAKKAADAPEKEPAYKLIFTDKNGAEMNHGFFYPDNTREKYQDALGYLGRDLKHIIHALYGEDYKIPVYETDKEMVDGALKLIAEAAPKVKVRIAVCYGTSLRPAKYLQLRTFPPFIENIAIPEEESKLKFGNSDQMTRVNTNASTAEKSGDAPW